MSDHISDDYEKKLLRNIEEFGWQATSVFDPKGEDPNFTYSIGFTSTLEAPEFIVFGLPSDLMRSMLWEVFRQIEAGRAISDGDRLSGLLEDFDCVVREVHPDNIKPEYLNSAIWYWHRTGNEGLPPVFQVVWPGKNDGLFPWDVACPEIVRELQPPLYLPAGIASPAS